MGGFDLSDLLWPDVSQGRQPQRPLEVSDRFSSRINRVIYPSCDRNGIVKVGTVGAAVTAAGMASAHASGSLSLLRAKFNNPYISGNGWVGFLGQFVTTSTVDAVLLALGSDSGSGGNTLFVIGPTGSGTLKHLLGGSNANSDWVDTGKVIADGKPHTVLLLSDGYQYKLFLDGKKLAEAPTGIGSPGFMTYQWLCAGGFRRTIDYTGGNLSVTLVASVVDYITDNEAAELTGNPWGSVFKTPLGIPFVVPSAGGGGLSLTGSLTGQGSTLSASATNTEVHALSGTLVGAGATLSGTATRIYSLTGALTGQGAALSGSATTLELHAATGALVGAGSTLSGAAVHAPVGINASGSLVGQGATLSATATNTEVHACTGALYGQGATLSGALTRVFSASGSLVGAGSTLSATAGNAVALFSATGSLVGQGSTLTGSATNTETHVLSGSLAGQGATLSATAALANLHTLSGSLVGGGAILVGYASGPTTALDAPPDAIVTVINKRNRVSVISRRS